ncbi:MAG TPA: aminopeptidase [Aggregatilineales bacterium]|nr:aminopeptidase [Anaerolineales bacterium]HRE47369.1 aminopeptidase [Aggregatilineales bacterium]
MDSRTQKMAEVIVNYSLAVKPGEVCLFRGTSPLAQPLMRALTAEALKAGGVPFNYVHMSGEGVVLLEHGAVAQIERLNPMLKLMYETASCIVRIEAEEETGALVAFPPEKQQAYMRSKGGIINIQMDREAARTLRRCTTLYPTPAYARDAGMSETDYENFVFGACMVAEPDPLRFWHELSAMQDKLITWLRGKKAFHVQGKNIDLTFSAEGRLWENANGKFNFPDGEIFTGPVENSVNGWVRFTYPAIYNGNIVRGAELHFKDGVVVKATAAENESFLLATLDTDEGARRLGEFAIGTNRGVNRFTGQILFDEKIQGTVHMALGKAYASTGAVNHSAIHWDMICDMRDGGVIRVDGETFYENGEFLVL